MANRARPRRRPIGASAGFAGPEERAIARIKSWRIHPHRLPAPPALKYARDHVYDPPRAAFDSHFDNR